MDASTAQDIVHDMDLLFSSPFLMRILARSGVFVIDYREGRALANDLWMTWGYSDADMLAGTLLEIIHPEDRETVASHYHRLRSGEEDSYTGEYRIRTKSGDTVWISVAYEVPERDAAGHPVYIVGQDEDVTSRHTIVDELGASLMEIATLNEIIEGIHQNLDLVKTMDLVMNHLRKVIDFDRASVQVAEEGSLRVVGSYGFREGILPEPGFSIADGDSPPARVLSSKTAVICNELEREFPAFIQVDPDFPMRSWLGIPLVVKNSAAGLIAIGSHQPGHFTEHHVGMAKAIARRIAMAVDNSRGQIRSSQESDKDGLTALPNRYSLDLRGRSLFDIARRNGSPLGVLLLDIDRFKVMNDRHGHDHGDRVLKVVGAIIAENLRGDDFPVRYGGDEFVILLPGANIQEAFSIAERIRLRIAYAEPDERGIAPTVSVGVHSGIPTRKDELHEFLACADRAMYEAKRMGRNRSCVSAESLVSPA